MGQKAAIKWYLGRVGTGAFGDANSITGWWEIVASINKGTRIAGWFRENPIKIGDLGVPPFMETPNHANAWCFSSFSGQQWWSISLTRRCEVVKIDVTWHHFGSAPKSTKADLFWPYGCERVILTRSSIMYIYIYTYIYIYIYILWLHMDISSNVSFSKLFFGSLHDAHTHTQTHTHTNTRSSNPQLVPVSSANCQEHPLRRCFVQQQRQDGLRKKLLAYRHMITIYMYIYVYKIRLSYRMYRNLIPGVIRKILYIEYDLFFEDRGRGIIYFKK